MPASSCCEHLLTASCAAITPAVHGPLPEGLEGTGVEVVDLRE